MATTRSSSFVSGPSGGGSVLVQQGLHPPVQALRCLFDSCVTDPAAQLPLELDPAEALPASFQVMIDRGAGPALQFPVEVNEELLDELLTADVCTAHDAPPRLATGLCPPAGTRPASRPCCQSAFCSRLRPRLRRERTVPSGTSRRRAHSS